MLWLALPHGLKSFISSRNPSTLDQARDSRAENEFKNHINYHDLLITLVSPSLDAVPNFLRTNSDRVRLPELRKLTPKRLHARNQPPAKYFRAVLPSRVRADVPHFKSANLPTELQGLRTQRRGNLQSHKYCNTYSPQSCIPIQSCCH